MIPLFVLVALIKQLLNFKINICLFYYYIYIYFNTGLNVVLKNYENVNANNGYKINYFFY